MKRAMIAVLAATVLAACNGSNPLIGKWSADGRCMFGSIEFTEKLVTTVAFSAPVKYTRDGARYIAALDNGYSFVFEKDGDALRMVSPAECRMVKN
jgi:hypothetical protein